MPQQLLLLSRDWGRAAQDLFQSAHSAIFDITGNDLTITLRNTSPSNSGQDVPGSTLTGLFWDFTGNPNLTPFSATVASGSIIGTSCSPGNCTGVTNVGGEFGYQAISFPGGADREFQVRAT